MNEDEIGVDVVVDNAEEEAVEIQNDILKGEKGDPGEDGVSPTVTTSKTGKVTTITITDKDGEHTATINDGQDGSGDMTKSVYDTDDNGIVDNAEKVNNHTVNKDVPSNAVFTDTVYDDTALAGRVSALESNKQDVLTAGTNISISNNTISTSAEENVIDTIKRNGVTQTITNKEVDLDDSKIADTYSTSSTYAVGDYCIYNDTLYKCTTAVDIAEEFDGTKWTATNIMAELDVEDITSEITFKETVVSDTTQFIRQGNLVHVMYQGESKAHSSTTSLATIPAKYRPKHANAVIPFVKNGNTYGVLQLQTGGDFMVSWISSTTNVGRIYANFTYWLK